MYTEADTPRLYPESLGVLHACRHVDAPVLLYFLQCNLQRRSSLTVTHGGAPTSAYDYCLAHGAFAWGEGAGLCRNTL